MVIASPKGTVETRGGCALPEVVQFPSEPVGPDYVASGSPSVAQGLSVAPVNFSRMACCCASQSESAERQVGFRALCWPANRGVLKWVLKRLVLK